MLKFITLHCRGLISAEARIEIMKWLMDNDIDIALIQETHIGDNAVERKKGYTWFFSGGQTSRESLQ